MGCGGAAVEISVAGGAGEDSRLGLVGRTGAVRRGAMTGFWAGVFGVCAAGACFFSITTGANTMLSDLSDALRGVQLQPGRPPRMSAWTSSDAPITSASLRGGVREGLGRGESGIKKGRSRRSRRVLAVSAKRRGVRSLLRVEKALHAALFAA